VGFLFYSNEARRQETAEHDESQAGNLAKTTAKRPWVQD